jgi:hypothetical protein
MRNRSHFRHGTFICGVCDRRTRHTGDNDSGELCAECWELAGCDNTHNDSATVPTEKEMAYYESLVAAAVKKGSNADKMRNAFEYIWK